MDFVDRLLDAVNQVFGEMLVKAIVLLVCMGLAGLLLSNWHPTFGFGG
jgi:hypothetical protein